MFRSTLVGKNDAKALENPPLVTFRRRIFPGERQKSKEQPHPRRGGFCEIPRERLEAGACAPCAACAEPSNSAGNAKQTTPRTSTRVYSRSPCLMPSIAIHRAAALKSQSKYMTNRKMTRCEFRKKCHRSPKNQELPCASAMADLPQNSPGPMGCRVSVLREDS